MTGDETGYTRRVRRSRRSSSLIPRAAACVPDTRHAPPPLRSAASAPRCIVCARVPRATWMQNAILSSPHCEKCPLRGAEEGVERSGPRLVLFFPLLFWVARIALVHASPSSIVFPSSLRANARWRYVGSFFLSFCPERPRDGFDEVFTYTRREAPFFTVAQPFPLECRKQAANRRHDGWWYYFYRSSSCFLRSRRDPIPLFAVCVPDL